MPLWLDQYIPTFPHFRLSACEELIKDLGLKEGSRLDVWTGSEWVTIDLHGIIPVEKGQRVILKIRPSLRHGLDDCPGIEEELKKEEKRGLKKSRIEFVSPIKKAPQTTGIHDIGHVSATLPTPTSRPAVAPTPATATRPASSHVVLTTTTTCHSAESATLPTRSHPKATTLPSQSQAKLKQWPFDFYVYEIHDGLCRMQDICAGSVSRNQDRKHRSKKSKGKQTKGRKVTVEKAFQAAFPNTKWAKTTFYDHRRLWFEQDVAIRELFIDLGESKQATYICFLDAIDHPSRLPSPALSDSQPKKTTYSQNKRRRSYSTSSSSSQSDSSDSPSPQGKKTSKPNKKRHRSYSSSSSSKSDDTTESENICRIFKAPPPSANLTPGPTNADNIDPSLQPFLPASPSSVILGNLGKRVTDLREVLDKIIMEPVESGFFLSSRGTFTAGSSLHKDLGDFGQWNAA